MKKILLVYLAFGYMSSFAQFITNIDQLNPDKSFYSDAVLNAKLKQDVINQIRRVYFEAYLESVKDNNYLNCKSEWRVQRFYTASCIRFLLSVDDRNHKYIEKLDLLSLDYVENFLTQNAILDNTCDDTKSYQFQLNAAAYLMQTMFKDAAQDLDTVSRNVFDAGELTNFNAALRFGDFKVYVNKYITKLHNLMVR